MTDQPARVTPGEISALLDQCRQLMSGGASLDEQTAYHQRKASLLSGAPLLDTAEAQQVAADAWHYVRTLGARRDSTTPEEAAP